MIAVRFLTSGQLWPDLERGQGLEDAYQPPGVLLVLLVHPGGLQQRPGLEIQIQTQN